MICSVDSASYVHRGVATDFENFLGWLICRRLLRVQSVIKVHEFFRGSKRVLFIISQILVFVGSDPQTLKGDVMSGLRSNMDIYMHFEHPSLVPSPGYMCRLKFEFISQRVNKNAPVFFHSFNTKTLPVYAIKYGCLLFSVIWFIRWRYKYWIKSKLVKSFESTSSHYIRHLKLCKTVSWLLKWCRKWNVKCMRRHPTWLSTEVSI